MAFDAATLLASLDNEDHEWVARGRHTHSHTAQVLAESGGSITVIDVVHETRTYQIHSPALGLHLVAIANFEDAALEDLAVVWQGTNIDVTNADILAALEALAATGIAAAEDDLTAKLTPA